MLDCECVHSVGERNISLASERVTEEHVGYGLEHWEDQRGWGDVPATRERKTAEDLGVPGNTFINVSFCDAYLLSHQLTTIP